MVYLDTNVLVYSVVNIDNNKNFKSTQLIKKLIEDDYLILSPLNIQELAYTLSKLKMEPIKIFEISELFNNFCLNEITCEILSQSISIAQELNFYNNFSDIVHLLFAQKYAQKLITFDKDFNLLKNIAKIEIEVL